MPLKPLGFSTPRHLRSRNTDASLRKKRFASCSPFSPRSSRPRFHERAPFAEWLQSSVSLGQATREIEEPSMRKLFLTLFAVCLTVSVVYAQTNAPASAALTVIRAGTLIDGTSDAPRKNQLIFVQGNKIEKVADSSAAIPSGAT